jgi:phosphate/sulfate permease
MEIQTAYIITGVLVFVGAIVAGGIIYSGLEKIAKAIEKQK